MIEWEDYYLNNCNCIMFWIPRNLKNMPALTTNIEWGRWERSGKVVLGFPEWAEKMKYISYYADKLGIPQANCLDKAVEISIQYANRLFSQGYTNNNLL